jgi:lipid-A-disaccharide synthase
MRKYVDRLLAILPFEEDYFRKGGVDCVFVGNPIIDQLPASFDAVTIRQEFGLDPRSEVIGLLPGSRKSEIRRLLPAMLEASRRLTTSAEARDAPRAFVLAHAPLVPIMMVETLIARSGVPVTVVSDRTYDVIAACDAVIVASGTATLQTALVGRPMTIIYRASVLMAAVFRHLIKVKWIGLANLVAGRQIAKELLQNDVNGKRLASATEAILADPTA